MNFDAQRYILSLSIYDILQSQMIRYKWFEIPTFVPFKLPSSQHQPTNTEPKIISQRNHVSVYECITVFIIDFHIFVYKHV